MGWAGAGHAALGEWRTVGEYAVLEGLVWGTAALNLTVGDSPGLLIPLAALDVLFRVHAASDAAHIAKHRRRKLGAEDHVSPWSADQ